MRCQLVKMLLFLLTAAVQIQNSFGIPNLQPQIGGGQDSGLVQRFNYFDLELLHEFSELNDNVFISPASIKTVLAMILEGAGGKCAAEIEKALRINLDQKGSRDQIKRLTHELNDNSGPGVLESFNSIFVSNKYKTLDSYDAKVKENYRANVLSLDFTNAALAARLINSWVGNATRGLIKDIVNSENFKADSTIVIANALYFKGTWKKSFDEQATRVRCFRSPKKNCANVEMMTVADVFNYRYIPGLDAQAIELPYSDNKYAMLILLPSERSNVHTLTRDLQHADLASLVTTLEETDISLELPKFEIEYTTDLVEYLKQLKIKDIFGPMANLTGIIPDENVKISTVVHKTKIQVNEKGTIAAAASGAVVIPLIGSSTIHMTVDRPFVFFIYNLQSKNIIFEGQLVEPTEATTSALPISALNRNNFQNSQKTGPYRQSQFNRQLNSPYPQQGFARVAENVGPQY